MSSFYTSIHRYKSNLLYRGWANGKRIHREVKFKPTMFIPTRQGETSRWKSIDGRPLSPKKFNTIYQASQYIREHKDIAGFQVHGMENFVTQFINAVWEDEIEFVRDDLTVFNFDIETESSQGFPNIDTADQAILSICAKNSKDDKYVLWGLKPYEPTRDDVIYHYCESEKELLHRFIMFWIDRYPDVITGWNIRLFDIPYLINRIVHVLGMDAAKKLSPWLLVEHKEIEIFNRKMTAYDIAGTQQLDYIDLFRKFGVYQYGTPESYKLDFIGHLVLGMNKISYAEHGSLANLYENDSNKFYDYNIRDTEIVDRLEDKMQLITLAVTIAYRAGVNYNDCFGTTGIWDSLLYREFYKRGVICPPRVNKDRPDYPGGHVKDPQVGVHRSIASFDVASLYPSLMIQYNMSPETIDNHRIPFVNVDSLLEEIPQIPQHLAMAANGVCFDKSKRGVVPQVIISLFDQRSQYKEKMLATKQVLEDKGADSALEREVTILNIMQQAIKILMNSLYGALGNVYFRYFDVRIAEAITTSGQYVIRTAEKVINNRLNEYFESDRDYVIAIDTDSLYLNLADVSDDIDELNEFCESIVQPALNAGFEALADGVNAYDKRIVMKREVLADRGVWVAKKRYVLNVRDDEGVRLSKPKLKIMGIEAIKSSTPEVCRDAMRKVFDIVVEGTEEQLQEMIREFKARYSQLPADEIGFPRSVSELDKYSSQSTIYVKGTPIHVRGSLMYNYLLTENDLDRTFERITNGDKIKFVYLEMPNPSQENVIAFPGFLPREFGVDRYIDYEQMFDKSFVNPIKPVLNAVGWEPYKTARLF